MTTEHISTTPKTTAYLATSIDGFIADEHHGLAWLEGWGEPENGSDYGYAALMDEVDVLLMGRNTFDTVVGFEMWPYTLPVYVLTSRPLEHPQWLQRHLDDHPNLNIESISGTPEEVLKTLHEASFSHVYVDGGRVVQQFLKAGALERLIKTTVPITLGRGVPLFGEGARDIKWSLVHVEGFSTGFVQSTYLALA